MDILITVAIAVYNNEKYVERCINSVINQDYSNLEILVIDDGSTDNSRRRIDTFLNDKRVKYYYKQNEGLSSVRQYALDLANGEYISFIDADDYLSNKYISSFVNALTIESFDMVICSTRFEDSIGSELIALSNSYTFRKHDTIYLSNSDIKKHYNHYLNLLLMSDSWNKFYRREFIRESKVKFEIPGGFNGSDLAFNHKLLLHRPSIHLIPEKNYFHVIYENSAVHRKKKKLQEGLYIICKQIIDETLKCGYAGDLDSQITGLFLGMERYILQDIYNENINNRNEMKNEIAQHKTIAAQFARKYSFNLSKAYVDTRSLELFKTIYLTNNNILLFVYLSLRAWLMNRKGETH